MMALASTRLQSLSAIMAWMASEPVLPSLSNASARLRRKVRRVGESFRNLSIGWSAMMIPLNELAVVVMLRRWGVLHLEITSSFQHK